MSRGCRHVSSLVASLLLVLAPAQVGTAEEELRLAAQLPIGTTRHVQIELNVGGPLVVENKEGSKQLPLSVSAELDYAERVLLLDEASPLPRR